MISSLLSWFNHFSSAFLTSLRSGFRNSFILDPSHSNAQWIWVLSLRIVWIVEFTRQNSRHTSSLFFPFSVCRIALNFPSKLGTFLLFVTVDMLLFCRSPVDCGSRKAEWIIVTVVIFKAWNLCRCWKRRRLALSRTRRFYNSQNSLLFGKLYWNGWRAMSLYAR